MAVPDGKDAVGAWERHRPDLVLLDLMLPGRSGVEIARDLPSRSDVPIIMVIAKDASLGITSLAVAIVAVYLAIRPEPR